MTLIMRWLIITLSPCMFMCKNRIIVTFPIKVAIILLTYFPERYCANYKE